MRRGRCAVGVSVGAIGIVTAVSAAAQDVRGSNWGDPPNAVREAETATFHHQREAEMAFVDSSVEGIDGGIIYLFEEEGGLTRVLYVSREDYPGGEGVLADFESLRDHLVRTLGSPGAESRRGSDLETTESPDQLASAIAAGKVAVSHRWSLEGTHVELLMTGKDGGVFLRALFQPSP